MRKWKRLINKLHEKRSNSKEQRKTKDQLTHDEQGY